MVEIYVVQRTPNSTQSYKVFIKEKKMFTNILLAQLNHTLAQQLIKQGLYEGGLRMENN